MPHICTIWPLFLDMAVGIALRHRSTGRIPDVGMRKLGTCFYVFCFTLQDTAAGAAGEAQHQAESTWQKVKDTVTGAHHKAADTVNQAGEYAYDTAAGTAQAAKDTATGTARAAGDAASATANTVNSLFYR
jgi:hypothetical protein